MVGEMRDADTPAIAVQAALTGHLVFSTIHTTAASPPSRACGSRDPLLPHRHHDRGIVPSGWSGRSARSARCRRRRPSAMSSARAEDPPFPSNARGVPFVQRDRVQGARRDLRDEGVHAADPRPESRRTPRRTSFANGDLAGMVTLGRNALDKVVSGITTWTGVPRGGDRRGLRLRLPPVRHAARGGVHHVPSCGYTRLPAARAAARRSPRMEVLPLLPIRLLKRESKRSFA
jgi:hypothetical protein